MLPTTPYVVPVVREVSRDEHQAALVRASLLADAHAEEPLPREAESWQWRPARHRGV